MIGVRTAAVVAALALCGCGGGSAPTESAPTSTSGSTGDEAALAAGSIVSEAYQFALQPVPGWDLMDAAEARRLIPGALAGAQRSEHPLGMASVSVEHLAGVGLEQAADLTLEGVQLENVELVSRERVRVADRPAIRMVLDGDLRGIRYRFVYVALVSRDHLYQLTSWTSDPRLSLDALTSIAEGFVLLDGAIEPPRLERLEEAVGDVWRVRDGRYESLASELAVETGEEWTLVVGDALREMNQEAEIGFHSIGPDIYGIVITERTPPSGHEAVIAQIRRGARETFGDPTGQDALPFDGGTMDALVHHYRGLEMVYGVRCEEDTCAQLLVWYAIGNRDAARARIRESFPSIARMGEPAVAALARDLSAQQVQRHEIGPSHALHGRRFTDFEHGMVLELPADQHWTVRAESDARFFSTDTSGDVRLFLHDPLRGIYGIFMVEPLGEPSDAHGYHLASRAAMGLTTERGTAARLGELEALRSDGEMDVPPARMRARVWTAIGDGVAYRFAFWGWPEAMDAARADVDRLVASARLSGRAIPTHRFGPSGAETRLVDERFRFTLTLPGDQWVHAEATPPHLRGRATMHQLTSPRGVVVAMGIDPATDTDAVDFVVDLMSRRMRRDGGGAESTITLAGRPGRHVRLRGDGDAPYHLLITHRGRLVTGLLVAGDLDPMVVARGLGLDP